MHKHMNKLALDCTTNYLSIALQCTGTLYTHTAHVPSAHAKVVLGAIDDLLAQAQTTLQQLDSFVVTTGPGSFTGVRTAVSVIQGLAFGVQKPATGLDTLMVLAEGAYRTQGATHVLSVLDARQAEVYWAAYARTKAGNWETVTPPQVTPPAQIALPDGDDWMVYGNYPISLKNHTFIEATHPEAIDCLSLAEHFSEGPAGDLIPVYVRNDVVHKKTPPEGGVS